VTRPREVSILARSLAKCAQAVAAGFAQVEAMQESTAAEREVPSGDDDVAALILEIRESVAAWSLTARPPSTQ
jgi:hypothetical protein